MASTKEPKSYYLRWLVHTFRGPWGVASLIGSILALVVPAALRYVPALSNRAATINDLLWQFPVGMLLLLAAVRFLTVPRSLHLEEKRRADDAEGKLAEFTTEQRPSVVVSRFEELVEDDPRAQGPYTNEYLRFTNVGPETALNVQIDSITLGGHGVRLWDPIDLIKPGDHEDRMPRGGLWTGIQRIRKIRGFEFLDDVAVPMVVKYTDRHGNPWLTNHAVISRGGDVRVELIRSLSAVEWTDISA